MNPYRRSAALAFDAECASAAQAPRQLDRGPLAPLLFAVGGLLALAGMIWPDDTAFAFGGLLFLAAFRRASAMPLTPRAHESL